MTIKFPYSFTDDLAKIKKNPDKFRKTDTTLKQLFKTNEYCRAIIKISMGNYNDKPIGVPISVKKYTQSHFDEDSVSAWVLQFYRSATEEEIEEHKIANPRRTIWTLLLDLKREYEYESGKRLFIKTIGKRLEEEGLEIKGGNSAKRLVGYVIPTVITKMKKAMKKATKYPPTGEVFWKGEKGRKKERS